MSFKIMLTNVESILKIVTKRKH